MKKLFLLLGLFPLINGAMPTRAPRPNDQEIKPNIGTSNPYFWDLFVLNKLTSKKINAEEELTIPTPSLPPTTDLKTGQIILLNGEPYYFDTLRESWLSMAHHTVVAARTGSQSNTYLALPDGLAMNENSIRIPYESAVTGASIQSKQGTTWRVASVGGDFTDLASAITSPLVTSGTDLIAIAEETFIVPSTITINKSLIIYGEGPGAILETAGTGADPVPVLSITVDNVILKNITVKQKSTDTEPTAINIGSCNKAVLDSLHIETGEVAIKTIGSSFTIKNCELHYNGRVDNRHRFILIGPHAGTSHIKDNTFYPNNDTTPARTIFCAINNPVLSGTLVLDGNIQAGTGTLNQFFIQDSMAGNLSLYFVNNSYQDVNGGIIFYGGANMLNSLTQVVIANNHVTNSSGKGLVTLDGPSGPGLSLGSTNWHIANNIIDSTILVSPFANATANPGEIAYATDIFTLGAPIVPSTTIPTTPQQEPRFSLEIWAKNNVAPLATLPVYDFGNESTSLNGLLVEGDLLQFYLNGTAVSPVACVYLQRTTASAV